MTYPVFSTGNSLLHYLVVEHHRGHRQVVFTDFLRKSSVFPAVAADLKPTEPESIRTISVLFTLGSKCIGIDKEGMVYTEGG